MTHSYWSNWEGSRSQYSHINVHVLSKLMAHEHAEPVCCLASYKSQGLCWFCYLCMDVFCSAVDEGLQHLFFPKSVFELRVLWDQLSLPAESVYCSSISRNVPEALGAYLVCTLCFSSGVSVVSAPLGVSVHTTWCEVKGLVGLQIQLMTEVEQIGSQESVFASLRKFCGKTLSHSFASCQQHHLRNKHMSRLVNKVYRRILTTENCNKLTQCHCRTRMRFRLWASPASPWR